jgi:hypothetical protein
MIWNCKPASGRMAQNDVASSLMIHHVANLTECLDCIGAGTNKANGSHADFNNSFNDRARNRLTMLLQTFEIALNGVTNVRHCFVAGFPLGYAARQSRTFGDKYAVFVWFDCDAKFHVASLPITKAFATATVCRRLTRAR